MTDRLQLEAFDTAPEVQDEVTAYDLEESLTEEAVHQRGEQQDEENDELVKGIREGLAELFEDGWTTAEMATFATDDGVRADIANGHGVLRAACAYLRREMAQAGMARKRGVPVTRATAAGTTMDNRIEHMTDAQFRAFSRRAREAALAGKKVRL